MSLSDYCTSCYSFKTDLASKYKHKPELQMMFNEQPFEVFSEIDLNSDGLISYEETVAFLGKKVGNIPRPHHANDTKTEYQEVDTNRDGYIQPEEFDRQLFLI